MSWTQTIQWLRAGLHSHTDSRPLAHRRALKSLSSSSSELFDLRPGAPRSLRATAAILEVRCLAGVVWLTREGDAEDYILGAGESLRLANRGRIVAQAIGASARIETC